MRKTLLQLLTFVLCITGMQNPLLAQEQTPLNQVVNTLKERISLSGYAQLGYTYDGHTGVIPAAIKAVEKVDELVGKAVDAVKDVDGVLFICADHGNAEKMIDYETGAPHTAHTTNPVPFILVNYDENYTLREGGRLCDIAPTLIEIMGLEKPVEMTGESLLVKKN